MFSLQLDAQTVAPSGTDVPHILSYQGQITSTDGNVVNGTHHITATLYSDRYGKTSLWQGEYDASVTNGIFNILLGSANSKLPDVSEMNRPLWVGIKVDGGEEMQPLTQLSAAPYALNVPDKSITTAKLAPDVLLSLGSLHVPTPQTVYDRMALSDAGGLNFTNGPQGTTITVLHGNASAAPAYSAVDLTADVTGILPIANGGTGSATTADWLLLGNAGTNGGTNTTPGTNFVGTTDNQAFEVHIFDGDAANKGSKRVMRWEPNIYSANLTGGYQNNIITGTGGLTSVGSTIGGGGSNGSVNSITNSNFSTIGGGLQNTIINIDASNRDYGTIAGGALNTAEGADATVCGGGGNYAGKLAFVGGGNDNSANATSSSTNNTGVIGGGWFNIVDDQYTTVGGGDRNQVYSVHGTVAGGDLNIINTGATDGAIGGGQINTIFSNVDHGTIAGGYKNNIKSSGRFASIPGGDSLVAQSYAQVVIGHNNLRQGTSTKPTSLPPTSIIGSDALFIIGNGTPPVGNTAGVPSNAFEVSNNGHSIVFHTNGSSPAVINGATYTDNVIYAWGSVTYVGGVPTLGSSFGVSSIIRNPGGPANGQFLITLTSPAPITNGVVAATLAETDPCFEFIGATTVSSGTFIVSTSAAAGAPLACQPADRQFTFIVTGR